ncbi:helix-turn-helix domain-containing protein [Clostridium sardiniense]|uniref:helix-turn-helix domain-containing protein n=1 Tax=Clostridium sardiniense TaxID=29369 RepID=UPI00195A7D6B|nr:helix-turn-helix transcriptional regulator [Clostridium sardiniense]MBM7835725.1 transcriptional regulator with XRE-family HTH domain [Clostridium sardiniense]
MLSDNLKHFRKINGLTLKELSIKSKVGASTISEIESGKNVNPRTETLSKIALALNVDVNTLINGENKDIINIISKTYEVDDDLAEFIHLYLQLDEDMKVLINNFIEKILNKKEAIK